LGAVVFVAAVILIVGTVWLSERFAGAAGGYRVRVQFDSIPGLQVGNPVTFRGVWVGKVLGITLEQGQPIVTLGFAELQGLPVDSRVLLKADGLLGGQMIEIHLGSSTKTFADNALVEGESVGGMEKVMADGGELVSNVNRVVARVGAPDNLDHLASAIAQFDTSAQNLNGLLNDNRMVVQAMLAKLDSSAGEAQGTLEENRSDLRETVRNLKETTEKVALVSQNMVQASESMKNTFENLDQVTGKMRKGEGTVGKLIQEDAVYEHLNRTLTSVDSLVEDIKKDPTRYFKFSVF